MEVYCTETYLWHAGKKNKLKGKKFHRKKKNVLRNENVFIHQKDKIKTLSEQKKSLAEKNLKQEAQGLCREPVRDRLVLHVTREENFTMFWYSRYSVIIVRAFISVKAALRTWKLLHDSHVGLNHKTVACINNRMLCYCCTIVLFTEFSQRSSVKALIKYMNLLDLNAQFCTFMQITSWRP